MTTTPLYTALGSSFASGPGIGPLVDVGAGRSGNNYAHLVAERLGLQLTDVTCGGATIDNILTAPQALRTGASAPPQLEAVTAETELVTVTVGGNDVGYVLTLGRYCYQGQPLDVPSDIAALLAAPVDRSEVDDAVGRLPGDLLSLFEAVRRRAPRARIVLVDYLTVVPPSGKGCAVLPMGVDDLDYCADLARRLAAAFAIAAREAAVDLLAASELSWDHSACSPEPWTTGWELGDVEGGGPVPHHPNGAGMRAVADALVRLLTS